MKLGITEDIHLCLRWWVTSKQSGHGTCQCFERDRFVQDGVYLTSLRLRINRGGSIGRQQNGRRGRRALFDQLEDLDPFHAARPA